MGDRAGRLGTGQRQHPGDHGRGQRRSARLARLVAQQSVDTLFGVAPLPAPDRRAADTRAVRHLQDRQPLGRQQDNVGPLHMLERAVPVAEDRSQAGAILRSNDDTDGLGHAQRIPAQPLSVNPPSGSAH